MTPFQKAEYPPENITPEALMASSGYDLERASSISERLNRLHLWLNDTYQVAIDYKPFWTHVSIRRLDRGPCRDWRDFQRIKNELLGPEFIAYEVYPPESALVDSANQYHLWAGTLPGEPPMGAFGFNARPVGDEPEARAVGAAQRPFDQRTLRLEAKPLAIGGVGVYAMRLDNGKSTMLHTCASWTEAEAYIAAVSQIIL